MLLVVESARGVENNKRIYSPHTLFWIKDMVEMDESFPPRQLKNWLREGKFFE